MATRVLDLTNVVNVTIAGTPTSLAVPNVNTVALFSTETPSWGDDYKIYTDPTTVATDFGANSKAAGIAIAFFAQQPNPLGTNGYLVIVPLASAGTELVRTAIARVINEVYFFGILIDNEMTSIPAEFATLTAYIQTLDKMFFYGSSVQAQYSPGGMLDLVRSSTLTNTRCLYYSDGTASHTQWFAAAYASRGLSTDFTGSNTAQTMHLKSLSGVSVDTTVDQTQLALVQTAGVDVYVSIAGVPSLFTSGQNGFFDQVYNQFWFKFALETAGYNLLRLTNTKIPQTETGLESLKNAYRAICLQAVTNGFAGPGAWNSSLVFGDPTALIRCVKDIGYYVYSLPVALQSTADRTARKAPLVQIAIKCQGAIHSSNVIVNVNL